MTRRLAVLIAALALFAFDPSASARALSQPEARTGALQQSEFRQFLPREAAGDGGGRVNAHDCGFTGRAAHVFYERNLVDLGACVRHHDETCDAAGSSSPGGRGYGLTVFAARLSGVHARVHETGETVQAIGIDRFGADRHAGFS